MKEIQLTQGMVALVDDADFEVIGQHKWCFAKAGRRGQLGYAARGRNPLIRMHQQILGFPGCDIDHVNGNGLDNRRENLRPATVAQNMANSRKRPGTTSRFKGVGLFVLHSGATRWRARIRIDDQLVHLGLFLTEEEAARAYDVAARKAWGDYASPNVATTPDVVVSSRAGGSVA